MGTSRGPNLEQVLPMCACQHTTENKNCFEKLSFYSKTFTRLKERGQYNASGIKRLKALKWLAYEHSRQLRTQTGI